jgi:enolase
MAVRACSSETPSGASTGVHEALELRDGEAKRYGGKGVSKAVKNVTQRILPTLRGVDALDQLSVDRIMLELDGTETKSKLGANAILAVSIAFARAQALQRQLPLYRHFSEMLGSSADALPRLTINLFSGGKHAGQQVSIQDVLIIPISAQTVDQALVAASDVYQVAAELAVRRG